jgi:DNA-binding transcriptional regulator YiaG
MTLAEQVRAAAQLPSPADRRRIRNQAKVSLAEMAAELKVTPVTVLRWEQGAFEPRRDRAIAYRDLLEALQDATAGTAA